MTVPRTPQPPLKPQPPEEVFCTTCGPDAVPRRDPPLAVLRCPPGCEVFEADITLQVAALG